MLGATLLNPYCAVPCKSAETHFLGILLVWVESRLGLILVRQDEINCVEAFVVIPLIRDADDLSFEYLFGTDFVGPFMVDAPLFPPSLGGDVHLCFSWVYLKIRAMGFDLIVCRTSRNPRQAPQIFEIY